MSSLKEKKRKVLQTRKNTTKRRKENLEHESTPGLVNPPPQLAVSLDTVVKVDEKTAKVTFEIPEKDPSESHSTRIVSVNDATERRKQLIEILTELRIKEKSQRRKSRVFIFVDGETFRPRNMRPLLQELGVGLLDMSLKKIKPEDDNRLQPLPGKILRRLNKKQEQQKKKSRERARLALGNTQGGNKLSCGFGAYLHERQANLEQDIAIDACKAGKANTLVVTDEACRFIFAKFRGKVDLVVSFMPPATLSMHSTRDKLVKPGGEHLQFQLPPKESATDKTTPGTSDSGRSTQATEEN